MHISRKRARVDSFKRSSKMPKARNNEYAKTGLSHRDKSENKPDLPFYDVGRDRFRLAFRTLNQTDFGQIFSQIQAEVEL